MDSLMEPKPILVLDDEPEILTAIKRDLRSCATVETFSSATDALNALAKNEYSVILSDLRLPQMSGLDFLEKAEKLWPNSQRILLTAFVDLASLQDSVNKARLNQLMSKPWEPAELEECVKRAQRQYETLAENQQLRRLALTDSLTGISNHRHFLDRLLAEFSRAKRYGRPLSIIMADIDNFKKFNDDFGHPKGDEVLRAVAQCLDSGKRSMDTVARYGGEEFCIVLPEVTRPQATEIANRHLEQVLARTKVSLSLGVASYPDDAKSPEELVRIADEALLRAKRQGKSRVLTALDLTK